MADVADWERQMKLQFDFIKAPLDMDLLLNAGSSPEKREFARIRAEQGVKAALAWRDARIK
jgi:hypothetical protein